MPWPTTSPGWSRPGSSAWTARQTPPSPPPPKHEHASKHETDGQPGARALPRCPQSPRHTNPPPHPLPVPGGRAQSRAPAVPGLGEALQAEKDRLPTLREHTEQGMANAAVAFAKAHFRQRIMAVTSSIGPGATNMLTSAALAHVARLPLLLLPADVFVSRLPDPVLQQVESFGQGDVSANDCFRPVTRYFDRIMAPEQLLVALPRALQVLTDPAQCGPVCLALPQDVQTFAHDWPEDFFHPALTRLRRQPADAQELAAACALLKSAKRPLIVAGGGVLYSQAWDALRSFAQTHG